MTAHVLLNLLNELGKRDKMRGLPRGRVGSIASMRPGELHFTFFCDMGVPCSLSNNSEGI